MANHWTYVTTFLLLLAISVCFGSKGRHGHGHGKHHDDDDDEEEKGNFWGAAAGLAVIIGMVIGGCALFSLAAWVTCALYSKCRKDRVGDLSQIKVGSRGSAPPPWSTQLIYKPELAAGFGAVSEGFLRLGPNHLVRNRTGTSHTDGAKWSMGMTKGKHVFEVTWPWGHRGYHASVGLAYEDAPLKVKGTMPLVGSNAKTWGLDIVKRKVLHKNKPLMGCPTDGSYVPDKFLVYVDLDEGTLGYGNEVTYWGEVINSLPRQGTQPLYLMVGATKWQSELSVMYKGSAPTDGDDKGQRPPHHLPPMYHMATSHPPTYREFDEKSAVPPVMVMPAAPPSDSMYDDSPPPYSRPPSGCSITRPQSGGNSRPPSGCSITRPQSGGNSRPSSAGSVTKVE